MIRVQSAVLCNAAQFDAATGLVSILGGWLDAINGPQLPIRGQIWLAGRLTIDADDLGEAHTFSITVEHDDGTEQVARVDGNMPPGPPTANFDPDLPLGIPLVLPFPLEFRRVGMYRVRLRVDGELLWEASLKVRTLLPQMG